MGKFHITGTVEWAEEREYHCIMHVDEVVESDNEESAMSRLRKTLIIDADEEDEIGYSGAPGWDRLTKKLKCRVLEHADPDVLELQERIDNLNYMRQYSVSLFLEVEK